MNDDWRVRITVHEHGLGVAEHMAAAELEHDLETSFKDRVIVSVDDSEVFCYAGERAQAEQAQALVVRLAAENEWQLDVALERWHPVAEEWKDADEPLPADEAGLAAEHQRLIEGERVESAEQGYPEFEVRVQCESHRACAELAEKLEGEGLQVLRRWRYLLIGAADEDSAAALAERIRAQAPGGCEVVAEANLRAVLETRPPSPFALFGGMGG